MTRGRRSTQRRGGSAILGLLLAAVSLVPAHAARESWHNTGSMHVARIGHTATVLLDGRVLVAGGDATHGGATATAEICYAKTGSWRRTGSMRQERSDHTATRLRDGRVLVAGGLDSHSSTLDSAELYDPKTGRWHSAGTLDDARGWADATLLRDGRVLILGGLNSDIIRSLDTAEIYNPATGAWSSSGAMSSPRTWPAVATLSDGRILVAGGVDAEGGLASTSSFLMRDRLVSADTLATAELFDPATGRWSSTGSMSIPRQGATATSLPDGRVLVAGGVNGPSDLEGEVLRTAETYDPATGLWHSTGRMRQEHPGGTATSISGGRVLVAGGVQWDPTLLGAKGGDFASVSSTEIYDSGTGTWEAGAKMHARRSDQTATVLPNGRVLVVGGANKLGAPLKSAELYP